MVSLAYEAIVQVEIKEWWGNERRKVKKIGRFAVMKRVLDAIILKKMKQNSSEDEGKIYEDLGWSPSVTFIWQCNMKRVQRKGERRKLPNTHLVSH